jgi:hypothetical protein
LVVVPIGGAQAAPRYLARFGPDGADLVVRGMCDAAEERYFRRALAAAGLGDPRSRTELERLGFFVCVEDLEDELTRALGRERVEALLDEQGALASFRTLCRQPAWRDQGFEDQFRRFLGAGAGRKIHYARLLVRAMGPGRAPHPLEGVLRRG